MSDDEAARVDERGSEDEASDDESAFERFSYWLNRQQWVPMVLFVVGLGLFLVDATWAVRTLGAAVAGAGLFPVVTGWYRGPFGILRGWRARARGLVSVGLGVLLLLIA